MNAPAPHPVGCLCDECLERAMEPPRPSAQPASFPRMPRAVSATTPDSFAGEIQEVSESLGTVDRRDRLTATLPPLSEEELARDIAAAALIMDCGREDDEPMCRLSEMAPCARCQQRIDEERVRADTAGMKDEDEYSAFVGGLRMPEDDGEEDKTASAVEAIPPAAPVPVPVDVDVPAPSTPPKPGTLSETFADARADVAAARNDLADILAELRTLIETAESLADDK